MPPACCPENLTVRARLLVRSAVPVYGAVRGHEAIFGVAARTRLEQPVVKAMQQLGEAAGSEVDAAG